MRWIVVGYFCNNYKQSISLNGSPYKLPKEANRQKIYLTPDTTWGTYVISGK